MTDRAAVEREHDEAGRELSAASLAFREAEEALQIAEDRFNEAILREQRAIDALHALPFEPLYIQQRQEPK